MLYISLQEDVLNCVFFQANRACARLLDTEGRMLSIGFVPSRGLWRPSCQDTHCSDTSIGTDEVWLLASHIPHWTEEPEMSYAASTICPLGVRVACFIFFFKFLFPSSSITFSYLWFLVTVLAFYQCYFSTDLLVSSVH